MATSRHSNKVLPPDNGAPQQSRCNPPSAGLVVRQSLLGAARTTDASLPETAAAMVTIALTPRQKRGAHPPTVRRAVRRGGDRGACQDRRLAPWRGLNPELGLSSGRRVSPKANPRAGVPCSLPRGRPALRPAPDLRLRARGHERSLRPAFALPVSAARSLTKIVAGSKAGKPEAISFAARGLSSPRAAARHPSDCLRWTHGQRAPCARPHAPAGAAI